MSQDEREVNLMLLVVAESELVTTTPVNAVHISSARKLYSRILFRGSEQPIRLRKSHRGLLLIFRT